MQTFVCSTERERARAYERIREELRAGRQAFVVCPLVEESEALQARAATAEFERLRDGELRDFRVVLMHGQLRPAAKQEAMAAVRLRRGRRARGHVGDRGRDRRPQRDRDAGRGRRSLRDLAAAPAPRADRPRRAPVGVPAVRAQGLGPAARAGLALGRVRAGRDRPRAARGGRAGRHPAARAGPVPRRRAAARRRAARARPRVGAERDRRRGSRAGLAPRTRCWPRRWSRAYGAEALAPIRA